MVRPILISLSPNTAKDDVILALKTILNPRAWRKGNYIDKLEDGFLKYFQVKNAISFSSARAGLLMILKSLGIKRSDEVLLQAFTCVVLVNAVKDSGAKPVFVDIEKDSFNIDISDLERKITAKSKLVIVQHTFGQPAKIGELINLTKRYKLFLIEDCAHCLGGDYKAKKLGTFGDAAVFSFGRDKIISSVFGGLVITNNNRQAEEIKRFERQLDCASRLWIFQQLLHPVIFSVIKPLYNFPLPRIGLGKLILLILKRAKLLSTPVTVEEKIGTPEPEMFRRLPNALARLACHQLAKLDQMNKKRKQIVSLYHKNLKLTLSQGRDFLLRYPILVDDPDSLLKKAKRKGILLGDWYRPVIAPKGVSLKNCEYQLGSCPEAEEKSRRVVNLPTYPSLTKKQVNKIIKFIQCYQSNR